MRSRPDIYIPGVTAPTYVQKLAEQIPITLAIVGAAMVLLATLFPFDFYGEPIHLFVWDITRHRWSDKVYDFLTNVILFIPLGLGVAARFMRGGFRRRNTSVLVAGLAGLALSMFVEIVQRYLPRRDPSLVDLISNTSGALIGGLIVRQWGERVMQVLPRALADELERPSPAKFGTALALWLAWPLALALLYAGSLSLDRWDPTAPLVVANEAPKGDRQWHGQVSEVHIVSRALSADELAAVFDGQPIAAIAGDRLEASYHLNGLHDFADDTGRQPPLIWQDDREVDQSGTPVFTYGRWLMTDEPPRELTRAIRETAAFTLLTTAASHDIFQAHDARIVSLSQNGYLRNVTLAQSEMDLVIRIRNGITGDNGSEPQWLVPNVFTDEQPRRIAITYNRGEVRAYINGMDRAYSTRITPAAVLVWGSFPRPAWALRMSHAPIRLHEWVLYAIIFIPAAILTAVQSTLIRHQRRPWLFLACILLPPVVLQILFAWLYQQPFDTLAAVLTTLLSAVVGVVALLRLKAWRRVVVSERP